MVQHFGLIAQEDLDQGVARQRYYQSTYGGEPLGI